MGTRILLPTIKGTGRAIRAASVVGAATFGALRKNVRLLTITNHAVRLDNVDVHGKRIHGLEH